MRILQLTNKSPWPPSEGGPMAMLALRNGLNALGHKVHTLTLSTKKFPVATGQLPKEYIETGSFEAITTDTKVRILPALWCLLSRQSLHVYRFNTKKIRKKLVALLQTNPYDLVIIEPAYMACYIGTIRQYSKAFIALRAHNLEFKIWERNAQSERNPFKRWYLKSLSRALKRFEIKSFSTVDMVGAISDIDAQLISQLAPATKVITVPFGIDLSSIPKPLYSHEFKGVYYHLGSMDWLPNVEGIRWLLKEIWPQIRNAQPQATLHLAGRNFPEDILACSAEGVIIHGEVESAREFIKDKEVLLVPLISGSGIRIKIIEAMAAGKTIITTRIGAEGIQYTDGKELILANNANEFRTAANSLFQYPARIEEIGRAAHEIVSKQHNYIEAAKVLIEAIGNDNK